MVTPRTPPVALLRTSNLSAMMLKSYACFAHRVQAIGRLAKIAFLTGVMALFISSEFARLSAQSHARMNPTWSPDGKHIAFTGGDYPASQVFIVDLDGTNECQVTDGPGTSEDPYWWPMDDACCSAGTVEAGGSSLRSTSMARMNERWLRPPRARTIHREGCCPSMAKGLRIARLLEIATTSSSRRLTVRGNTPLRPLGQMARQFGRTTVGISRLPRCATGISRST
jgi:WD40 repeat protein